MIWDCDAEAQLRALWAEEHSAAEIGRRMGISKGAALGKAHRMLLPARPSPIPRAGTKVLRLRDPTSFDNLGRPTRHAPRRTLDQLRPTPAVLPLALPAPSEAPSPAPVRRSAEGCKWPQWNNQEPPTHRYCDAPRAQRPDGLLRPYCAPCAARARARLVEPNEAPHPGAIKGWIGWGGCAA